jgi:hypothetical protein
VHTCSRVQSTERDKTHIYVAVVWLYCLQSIYPLQKTHETKHTSGQLADKVALSHGLWNNATFPVSAHGPIYLIQGDSFGTRPKKMRISRRLFIRFWINFCNIFTYKYICNFTNIKYIYKILNWIMNSLWDIRIFLGLVPKQSLCISSCFRVFLFSLFNIFSFP